MEQVGIFEAKARLSELVERAEAGDEVTLTRHGKAVARIVPVRAKDDAARRSAIFDEIEAFSRTVKTRRFNLRRMIESGRK
ncbi:MAG: type II toxin-antitoxin system prevent-host-death family antitoxin [Burkholderiales bacterium]|nr:type II toxin-antitoxin system prevent-host-death family antitoxin [Burkholderiales bacterium]